ncbi:hypothetical protein [Hydrocarboniphaga effusa]|jgi:hypothetical protein|uniref:hypothetical protein n=1 Tax=Hydrocarboniphaga effusa TaxID=243629 RepID=UPI003137D2EE
MTQKVEQTTKKLERMQAAAAAAAAKAAERLAEAKAEAARLAVRQRESERKTETRTLILLGRFMVRLYASRPQLRDQLLVEFAGWANAPRDAVCVAYAQRLFAAPDASGQAQDNGSNAGG